MVAYGPANTRVKSSTLIPFSGGGMALSGERVDSSRVEESEASPGRAVEHGRRVQLPDEQRARLMVVQQGETAEGKPGAQLGAGEADSACTSFLFFAFARSSKGYT